VELCFGPDQMETFEAARDEVLARFGRWSETPARAVFDAQVLLDWKWGYEDGDLARAVAVATGARELRSRLLSDPPCGAVCELPWHDVELPG
jgi:hypothetical protein